MSVKSAIANIFGGTTNINMGCEPVAIIDGDRVKIRYKDPDDDNERCYEGIDGSGAVFIQGYANAVSVPNKSEIRDDLDEVGWTRSDRYAQTMRQNLWKQALHAVGESRTEKLLKMGFAGLAALQIIMLLIISGG